MALKLRFDAQEIRNYLVREAGARAADRVRQHLRKRIMQLRRFPLIGTRTSDEAVTSDFVTRISLHKQDLIEGFTKRYGVHMLVYIEFHHLMPLAIRREKQIKRWRRDWKIELIEKRNPGWRDLYPELSGLSDPETLKKWQPPEG